jgi:hypothetical protein
MTRRTLLPFANIARAWNTPFLGLRATRQEVAVGVFHSEYEISSAMHSLSARSEDRGWWTDSGKEQGKDRSGLGLSESTTATNSIRIRMVT